MSERASGYTHPLLLPSSAEGISTSSGMKSTPRSFANLRMAVRSLARLSSPTMGAPSMSTVHARLSYRHCKLIVSTLLPVPAAPLAAAFAHCFAFFLVSSPSLHSRILLVDSVSVCQKMTTRHQDNLQ